MTSKLNSRVFSFSWFLTAAISMLISLRASAQSVPVDSTSAPPLDGFELYGNGLYWWNDGQTPDENNPARVGHIGIRALEAGRWIVSRSSKTYLAFQSIELRARYQSVARNDEVMFYFADSIGGFRFFRQPIYGASSTSIDFTGRSFSEAGAVLLDGSTVYFNVRGGAASSAGEIRTKAVNGPPGGGDVIFKSGMGLVKKMKMVTVVNESNLAIAYYLFILNTDGQLWHVRLPSIFDPSTGPLTLYAVNVTDFDARVEFRSVFDPPFFRRVYGTQLYGTTGFPNGSGPSGKLYTWNLTSGGTVVVHDTQNSTLQLTGVALDNERIFFTQTPTVHDSVNNRWLYNWANGSIWRKTAPVNNDVAAGPSELIHAGQDGRNLRSDTQWLYYAHGNQIRKIKTDTPALQLDYRAVGVEVVQSVQDFNNSIPILAGKPTLVRGYGQLVQNTTGRPRFRLTARLLAFRNGAPLPGAAFAYNQPVIDIAGNLATLRPNLNRSFLFELPLEWISEAGPLQLRMMVNADGTAPETGSDPFGNNTAIVNINVAPARVPCLVFKALSSPGGDYNPAAPNSGFADIIDRAGTLLPVSGFKTYISPGSVTKPVVTFLGIKQRSFSMPGDKEWALLWMTMAHAFSRDPEGCLDTHWVGMLPSTIGTWNGIGGCRGVALSDLLPGTPIDFTFPRTALDNTSVIRMEPGQGNSANSWSSVGGGHTLAHELGHNYGRFHIDQTRAPTSCGGSAPERPWHTFPGNACTLGPTDVTLANAPIGYDRRTGTLVLPNMAGDMMSYASSRWVSPFSWNALLGAIPVHLPPSPGGGLAGEISAAPAADSVFMAQGIIDLRTRTVTLLPLYQLPAGTLDADKVQESLDAAAGLPANAPFRLRLLNAGGTVLDNRAIIPLPSGDGPNGAIAFVQAVPNLPGAARLEVLDGGTVLGEAERSANPPILTLGNPEVNNADATLALDWTASDADGDTLLFTVQYSADNGAAWQTLRVNDPALGVSLSTALLPGGAACRLRVIATDGFHTAIGTSAAFVIGQHVPVVTISGLRNQDQIPYNSNAVARAFAYDAEDGSIEGTEITWTLAGPDTRTGVGGQFSLKGLAPGNYTLTARAPDTGGNVGSVVVVFKIRPLEISDGATPEIDGLCDDLVYGEGSEVRLVPSQTTPSARFVHASSSLYVCFDGLPYSSSEGTPANINFYINGDGVPSSAPQANDVGFGVDENGVPARARGTGSGWTAELSAGFEVKTFRSASSWSAEFRVPDSDFGGWNHESALTILLGAGPGNPILWPNTANVFNPSTWTPASFGPLPALSNRPPVAVAFGPEVVSFTEPQLVELNGSGSYDLDANPLSYSWMQVSGPSVMLTGANTVAPSFQTPALTSRATVTFRLIVHDGTVNSPSADVEIVLEPTALVASGNELQPPVKINAADGSATVQLLWPGAPGSMAVIQASQDLVHWENIATNSASYLGALLQIDAQAGNYRYRFYRAVSWEPPTGPTRAELYFDGTDDYVEIPHAADMNSLPLTITAWIRTTQTTGGLPSIITKADGTSGTGYGIALESGHLVCFYLVNLNSTLFAATADGMPFVADGFWHHVAYVVTVSGARIYLDGSLVKAHGWTGSPGPTTNPTSLKFGVFFGGLGAFYQGDLDEVSLWNRALSDVEVNRLIPGTLLGSESGLIGYWALDEGAGTTTTDNSGRGHAGALRNNVQWFPSSAPLRSNPTAGSALRFDGVDDQVTVAHASALNAFPLTISAWVKTAQNSPGYVSILNKYPSGAGNGYSLHINNGRVAAFYFRGDGASYVYASDPGLDGGFIADGRWHHVAYVVDASGGRIYVDGAQTGSLGWTGTPGPCTTPVSLFLGPYPFSGQTLSLDGRLDELTLWNRALSATEINSLMNTKQTGAEPGLLGYWEFDEATGTTANDATGHGHNGTLQFGPLWVPSDARVYP